MAVHVLGFMASNPVEFASVVGFGSFTWLLGILEPAVAGYALRLYRKLGARIAWWVFATFSLLALGHFLHASGATSRVIDSPVSSNIVALLIPFLLLIGMAHTESTLIDARMKRKEPELRVQNDPHAQKRIADLIQQTEGLREQVARLAEREKSLENSAQQYYLLFTNNPQPMWVFDLRSLQILAANDAAQVQYGFTQQEFLGRTARDLLPAEETEAFLADVGRPADDGQSRRVWHQRHKDGSTFEVEVRAVDLNYADCAARLIVASDSTHRQVGDPNCQVGGSELRQEEKLEVISGVVSAVAPATAVQPASAPSGPKTILLVEPDARMRTMMRTVLEWNRYRVVETDSPSLAMTVWPSQSKNVDLLLTAITLPGAVSGRQLAEQLRRDKPSMKVLYTYDSSKRPDGFEQLKAQELVAKPFTSVELLESISRCVTSNIS